MRKIYTVLALLITSLAFGQDSNVVAAPRAIEDMIFTKVEFEAEYPGGTRAWSAFISQNLRGDVPSRKKAPAGTYNVVAQFIVDKTGKVTEVKALTNHGYGMEEEVVRVIRRSPRWTPARQDGRWVKAYRNQPITFVVGK
jgi:protein TonB